MPYGKRSPGEVLLQAAIVIFHKVYSIDRRHRSLIVRLNGVNSGILSILLKIYLFSSNRDETSCWAVWVGRHASKKISEASND